MATQSERLDFEASPKAQPELWLPRINRLLREQLEHAGQLRVLSEQAAGAMGADDHEGFDRTLDQRDAVLRSMGLNAEELRAPLGSFTSLAASLTDEQAREIREAVATLNHALDGVSACDERVRLELERRRGELGRELAREAEQWGRARAAAQVYGSSGHGSAAQASDTEA